MTMVRSDQVPISPTSSCKLIGLLPAGQRAGTNESLSHYLGQAGNRHQPSSHHSPPLERPLATSALVAPAHRAARLLELPHRPLWSMILLQTVHIQPSPRQLLLYVARHLLADHVGLLAVLESLLSTWSAETASARTLLTLRTTSHACSCAIHTASMFAEQVGACRHRYG